MSKKERDVCEFEWNLRKRFCCCSNLSNDDGPNYLHARFENGYGFYRPGLKTGVENDIIRSDLESGFGEPGGTPPPPPRIHRSTPSRIQKDISVRIKGVYVGRIKRVEFRENVTAFFPQGQSKQSV